MEASESLNEERQVPDHEGDRRELNQQSLTAWKKDAKSGRAELTWVWGLRSKSRMCLKGILPLRSPNGGERAGGRSHQKRLQQLSNCKWLPPCHLTSVSPKSQRWGEINKGTRNTGRRTPRWHLGAGEADKNAAEWDRLRLTAAQSRADHWPWRKLSDLSKP